MPDSTVKTTKFEAKMFPFLDLDVFGITYHCYNLAQTDLLDAVIVSNWNCIS